MTQRRGIVVLFVSALIVVAAGMTSGAHAADAPLPAAATLAAPPAVGTPRIFVPVLGESETKWLKAAMGLRTGLAIREHDTGVGVFNVRPFFNGQVHEHVKFETNFDLDVSAPAPGMDRMERMRVLDAVVKVDFHDLLNLWVGRFLPPSDRANLSGPYCNNGWVYPSIAHIYPNAIYGGRDDGAALWGQVKGGQFKYSAGVFNMNQSFPNKNRNNVYAGRVVINLLDPEPGYYNFSTYYGAKDILALGGSVQYQKEGGVAEDLLAYHGDLLAEKKLGGFGTATLEGAYFNRQKGGKGHSFMGVASYLLPWKIGAGYFQPNLRVQKMMGEQNPTGDLKTQGIDAFLNYIIDGHSLRVAAGFTQIKGSNMGTPYTDTMVQIGLQTRR